MSLQGADDVDLDAETRLPRSGRRATRCRTIGKNPEYGRTAARHYSRGGTQTYKVPRNGPEEWMTVETWPLQVVPGDGPSPPAVRRQSVRRRGRYGRAARFLSRCVKPSVSVPCPDRQRGIERVGEDEVERRHPSGGKLLPSSSRPGGSTSEEEGDVRSHLERCFEQGYGVADLVGAGQRAEHGRCVRAAAAEPRRDRDALLDQQI